MTELIEKHRRFLPHYQEAGQVISLTWRLEGELPLAIEALVQDMKSLMIEIKSKSNKQCSHDLFTQYERLVQRYDDQLGKHKSPGLNLIVPEQAIIITTAFHFYNKQLYILHAYCIMPNHVHLLLEPLRQQDGRYTPISDIVRRLKGYTAKQITLKAPDTQNVWRADYFDRFIRSDRDYINTVLYILNNPVKASLISDSRSWPLSYYKGWLEDGE